MNLQTIADTRSLALPPGAIGRPTLDLEAVRLRHLKTHRDIESVLHLRSEIDLSVHLAAGPEFAALEKKETSAVLCLLSTSTAK